MEGVVMSSPRKARTSTSTSAAKDVKGKGPMLNGDAAEDDEEEDPLALISPKKLDLGVASTRPKTPSASTRPTRIARPARPLSALADNRIVDRIGSTASSSITRSSTRAGSAAAAATTNALGMARSKAAKDLNVVLETHATGTITTTGTGAAGAQGRYSLRNGRTTSANGNVTTSSQHPPNSPSKLPQPPNRVLGKRDAVATRPTSASSSSSATTPPADLGPGFDPAVVVATTSGGKIVGGRNVRRRRSSMGGHETVNAG